VTSAGERARVDARCEAAPRHPEPLRIGGHVRVVSPSWPAFRHLPQRVRRADDAMRRLGLRVSYGPNAGSITSDGTSAGSAEQRASDLMEALTDPDVDVVICALGGSSSHEVLPLLDARRLRGTTTAFVGNSDNVWLNHYLYREVGLSSFYGATYVAELGEAGGPFPETLRYFEHAVMSTDDLVCRPFAERCSQFPNWSIAEREAQPRTRNHGGDWHWMRHGAGFGPLVGAELDTLIAMADHFDLNLDGSVLFWDVGLQSRRPLLDKLRDLAQRVRLDRLAGMLVGPDARRTPPAWAGAVARALDSVVPNADYPVVVNADIGHLDPKWVVPYGREVHIDSSQGVVFRREPSGPARAAARTGGPDGHR
jgi:muramoyltetrapeptide carboxypeptidase